MSQSVIASIRELNKSYGEGTSQLAVLKNVNLDIFAGEFIALLGASGSGKSTLLNLISGIDRADSGKIRLDDTDMTQLSETQQTRYRRDHIGIVFQFFNLIPTLTVLENITLPQELKGMGGKAAAPRALELLRAVKLDDRAHAFPDRLSGGEQQRVAIARALLHEPKLVLADEPTGNLDEETGGRVLQLLLALTRHAGKTLVMATHSMEIAQYADRVCRIQDGALHFLRA